MHYWTGLRVPRLQVMRYIDPGLVLTCGLEQKTVLPDPEKEGFIMTTTAQVFHGAGFAALGVSAHASRYSGQYREG